ncbi:M1 family metallopeptidase, partial [Roseisolibacter sp. H3M3-2]|uniref:M1 family metallopeptidase n=1 Tax=Roseisolibacter sp. H3M3-2 TaxID=3031323 RepID=UPI0023DB4802
AWALTAAALALAAGAARQPQAQVMTPVRLDASTVLGAAPAPADAPLAPFAPLDRPEWAGPNAQRGANGAPGPAYWQQRADYQIAAALDTARGGTVSGTVRITYTNNSPDSLRFVWLQLDQNLYRASSLGSALFAADSRWGVRGFQGGIDLADVAVDGRATTPKVDDTRARLDLAQPIAPRGGRATITMRFRFAVPEHGSDRMGRDGTHFEIAQWYPRMAVYDDVRGWNTDPYLGQGEFYLEYGDIDYAVTVPAGYVVAGSGTLQNAGEVLSAAQRDRLARARAATATPGTNDGVVQVVTAAEAEAGARTPVAGTKTWRFRAESVRDAAWAAAPDLRWDATSWSGVLCQAYYPWPRAGRAWESGAEQTCWSIRTYSQLFFPYPYPQATSVAGPVGGMEYPMLVMVHYGSADPASIFETLDHEQGHEWFPMVVGTNERRYAWQDEGFNTYINAFSGERRYPGTTAWPDLKADWERARAGNVDAPLMTRPDHLDAAALGPLAYRKPAAVLLALRNHVVGAEAFDRALREYARRWAFRHPTPGDFFRTVEDVTGDDLAWFWRAFWYGTEVLDLALEGVETTEKDGARVATLTVRRTTGVPFPIAVRLKTADGQTRDVRVPVDVWARARGDRVTVTIPVDAAVTGARLWPDPSAPDWEPANDAWGDAPAADRPGPVTTGAAGRAVSRR